MKKNFLNNNRLSINDIEIEATNFMPQKLILRSVSTAFKYADGKRTEEIEGINYDVVNPDNLDSFRIKTLSPKPIITQKELDDSETHIYISIPLEQTIIKPYRIEFGFATVSILAPYVLLVKNERGGEQNK